MSAELLRPEILRMQGYVPGEQPRGGKFIKLNTNENPYPPSSAVGRAIEAAWKSGLQRYPDPLATAFRLRAAALHDVSPDAILCGNGSDDILTIVTRAFVGAGDVLRFPYPSYVLYKTLAEIQGAFGEHVEFERDWSLPREFAAPRDGLRLAVLANPNSPSGTVIPRDAVLQLAQRLPCPLLVDEAYADFAEESCLPLVERTDRILVSRSLSKSYALAGLRFGYLVADEALVEQLIKVKDSYNCDALSIAAATAAIDDQAWLHDTRGKIIATRERLAREMRGLGFSVVDSQANFVWGTHATVAARLLQEQLKERGILVRYMDYPGWGDGLRVSVGTEDQVDAFLSALSSLL